MRQENRLGNPEKKPEVSYAKIVQQVNNTDWTLQTDGAQ